MSRHSVFFVVATLWLILLVVRQASCAGGRGSSSRSAFLPSQEPLTNFLRDYGFLDGQGNPIDIDRYRKRSEVADETFDAHHFYAQNWFEISERGRSAISQKGNTLTPEDLRNHPAFANFFDGNTHTPVVFKRIADIMPKNPSRRSNPDVAVFMHKVTVTRLTNAQWWLDLKCIIRGQFGDNSQQDSLPYRIVWSQNKPTDGSRWLNEAAEVFKWPVRYDLERFGYSPNSIERELSAYPLAQESHKYQNVLTQGQLLNIAENSKDMLERLNNPYDKAMFHAYALVQTTIDDPTELKTWFQAPIIYGKDQKDNPKVQMYSFNDHKYPVLDRIQFKHSLDREGTSVLIPIAIVRPTRAVPSLHFKTIYTLPKDVGNAAALIMQFKVDPFRLRSTSVLSRPPGQVPFETEVFGLPRPLGHPFRTPYLKWLDDTQAKRINLALQKGSQGGVMEVDREQKRSETRVQRAGIGPSARTGGLSRVKVEYEPYLEEGTAMAHVDSPPLTPTLGSSVGMSSRHALPLVQGEPSLQHHPQWQTLEPMQSEYMPGQPNPYEIPQENALATLESHFKPELEDAWRYAHYFGH